MTALKVIRYELLSTFARAKLSLLLWLLMVVFVQMFAADRFLLDHAVYSAQQLPELNAGESLLYAHWGMEPFDPDLRKVFMLDMPWAAPFFLLAYFAASLNSQEAQRTAYQTLPRIQSRFIWIAGKIVCALVMTFVLIAVEILLVTVIAGLRSGEFFPSFDISGLTDVQTGSMNIWLLVLHTALLVVPVFAFVLLVMLVAFAFGSIASYLIAATLVIASAYFELPLFFLGGSMVLRSGLFTGDWSYVYGCAAVSAVVFVCSVVLIFAIARKAELK